jgi:EAL domain-containing protein (putative c-di-GMP-specific phosphodiesterase class I)
MGPIAAARSELADLEQVVACREFSIAFQPIVDLADRTVVGFEALTRFDSGRAPTEVFASASRWGVSEHLELTTLESALEDAGHLPRGTWISVNISAETMCHGARTRELVSLADRPVVLELTEHEPVYDYACVRRSLHELPGVRLAVDDTGSGFASLRHVIELRPAFIKADRVWVHGLAQDPCRQAIVRGLCALADASGAQVIAEGVERPCDMAALANLGIPLAQGFLLGEPAGASVWM